MKYIINRYFFLIALLDFYLFILFIPSLILLPLLPFLCDNVKFILLLYWINNSTNNNNVTYLCCAYEIAISKVDLDWQINGYKQVTTVELYNVH